MERVMVTGYYCIQCSTFHKDYKFLIFCIFFILNFFFFFFFEIRIDDLMYDFIKKQTISTKINFIHEDTIHSNFKLLSTEYSPFFEMYS